MATLSALSRTRIADPSDMTNPSLFASKGLLASCGSSLRRDSAWQALKPATAMGQIGASVPPAIAISTSPC